jgi:tRNA G18 (ribose-2'-O)-methylase SpoU
MFVPSDRPVPRVNIIPIDDPDDPRVASYRDIRERDLAGREGRFIAEGKVVLDVLFSARRFEAESVLLLENRLSGMAATLAKAPPDMPVYLAPTGVIDRIAGFHLHRGVLAVGRRRPPEPLDALLTALPARATVVVLVGIANHDNAGAIFRNAAAFDVDAVFLDATSCDPLYRKAIRVSVGAALKVPFHAGAPTDEILAALGNAGFVPIALSPGAATDIRTLEWPERTALVLGTEGEGLPPALLARLATARIAMAGGLDSLNVATAAAIALHEAFARKASER